MVEHTFDEHHEHEASHHAGHRGRVFLGLAWWEEMQGLWDDVLYCDCEQDSGCEDVAHDANGSHLIFGENVPQEHRQHESDEGDHEHDRREDVLAGVKILDMHSGRGRDYGSGAIIDGID